MNGYKGIAFRILMEKPGEKRALGRPRRSLVEDIKIHLGLDGVVWIGLI
jgi:hypothetical protein